MKPVRLHSLLFAVLVFAATFTASVVQAADPLPSWNDGPAKMAIVRFVSKVTTEGGPDFVPPAERIATFDNDGTLRAEQPMYFQLLSALDVTYKVNGQAVAQGRVPVTARLTFTANDCLDLGSDLGPPGSLDCLEQAVLAFHGRVRSNA